LGNAAFLIDTQESCSQIKNQHITFCLFQKVTLNLLPLQNIKDHQGGAFTALTLR
jgi:hypothetical protein